MAPTLEAPPGLVFGPGTAPEAISAASWALYSVDGETMLWESEADTRRAMASVTKVMTALIVAEEADLAAPVVISEAAANTGIGYPGQARILQGDAWTVEELLDNLLVQSGNDAAVALAEHVAGTVEAFVALMNEKAEELGMADTSFANPNGLDAPDHYSTARDLVALGLAAIENPRVVRTTRIKYVTFDPGQRDPFTIRNSNRLLGTFPGIFGLKTGDTLDAGLVLLSYLDTGSHRFIGVVMGADDGDPTTAIDHLTITADMMGYALGTFSPSDYVLAPLVPADIADVLPDWLRRRLEATGALPTGAERLSAFATTPGERSVIAALGALLPEALGGSG
jgi:D-alanyl-D-alanine carboxypeptidase